MDGIILVQETIHSLNVTKKPGMLVKFDIAKSYDKLSWKYMRSILEAFGFGRKWIEWRMNPVSTPFFSFMVSGSPTRILNLSWGIRKGDPLSPFLFILMEEGISKLFEDQSSRGEIHGLNIQERMDKRMHQQFLDATILMGHPSLQEA